jgi:hypothetical protein
MPARARAINGRNGAGDAPPANIRARSTRLRGKRRFENARSAPQNRAFRRDCHFA